MQVDKETSYSNTYSYNHSSKMKCKKFGKMNANTYNMPMCYRSTNSKNSKKPTWCSTCKTGSQEPMPLPPQSLASLTSDSGSLGLEQSLPLTTSWQWLLRGTYLRSGGLMVFMWTQRWMALTCTYWCHLCSPTRSTMVAPLKFKGQTSSTKNIGKYQWFQELEFSSWLVVCYFGDCLFGRTQF